MWGRWYFVFAELRSRFNFTIADINDPRKAETYSVIATPEGSVRTSEFGLKFLAHMEKELRIVFSEHLQDIRTSISFAFWFNPFDWPTWMLIIR